MKDYVTIGCTPSGEDCAQVGRDDYYERMRKETQAFVHQLRRQFGEEKYPARLSVKGFPHDFGTYHEVVCYYDDEDEDSVNYAFKLESEMPEYWDEQAKHELGMVKIPC